MTPDSPPAPATAPHRPYRRLRVPAFYPVPVRTRRDGWTIERQADFLGMLAECGSAIGACEGVGMSRKSAYRLRALPGAESFAAAWDAVLGSPLRKVTAPARDVFGWNPLVHLVVFRGRYRGAWYNAANGDAVSHDFRRGEGYSRRAEGDSEPARASQSSRQAALAPVPLSATPLGHELR